MDIKTRLEALENLRQGAWRDYDSRRSYEWKIGISIWSALSLFIASVLTGRIESISPYFAICLIIIEVIIIILHWRFINGISLSLEADREKQFFFEGEVKSILDIELPKELSDKIDKILRTKKRREKNIFFHWSQAFQMGITVLLCVLLTLAVFSGS